MECGDSSPLFVKALAFTTLRLRCFPAPKQAFLGWGQFMNCPSTILAFDLTMSG
ncbi:hypothetical protein THTE_0733 [Thermogutta terrifontis]|uniref:Uncharacterized protein n=1 Tax=Thermogutta terrifontis TaxID=1331910 RepID=A0A286RBL0_9BACT|nr:hypothetical protein THTE_0733 [Thermogutta terrifontis]